MHFSFIKYLAEAYCCVPNTSPSIHTHAWSALTSLNKHEDGKNSIIVKNK